MVFKIRITNYELRIMVFAVLSIILASLFIIHPVYAQTPVSPATTPYNLPTSVSPTSPLYTDLLVSNLFHTFSCLGIGQSVIGQPCLTYQFSKNAQGMLQGVPVLSQVDTSGGVLGTTTSLIGMLFTNPPVRTADYLASVGKDLGIVKEAKAQVIGSGAAVLNPILGLWTVSRNISYIIMIIIFVIIGLMVMFRTKINPQTVITAQAALPGLVLGLILITFSYFFAGLISDTAFIGTNMVGYYFQAAQNKPTQNLVQEMATQNALGILSPLTKIVNIGSVSNALGSIWDNLAAPNSNLLPWNFGPQQLLTTLAAILIAQFVLPFGSLFGGIGQLIGGGAAAGYTIADPVHAIGFALSFVAMAVLIYTMFRLLLRLVNTYLTIIFLTLTAPFQFLAAALPGRQGMATEWILNMLANVLAFPAVIAVLYFVAFILGPNVIKDNCIQPCPFRISQMKEIPSNNFANNVYAEGETSTRPDIIGNSTFPLLGGFDLSFIKLLLAFGALVALPAIPEIIQRTISKVSQAGQLLGQEIGGGIGQGQRYAGQIQQGASGFAGQVGRVTDTTGYMPGEIPDTRPGAKPGATIKTWIVNPYGSSAGLKTKVQKFFGKKP